MKQKKEVKSLICFACIKICRELWAWILFGVCLLIIALCYFDFFKIPSHSPNTAETVNDILAGLAMSYVGGMIFRIAVSFTEELQRFRAFSLDIAEELQKLSGIFKEFSHCFCGSDWCNESGKKDIIEYIIKSSHNSCGIISISDNMKCCIIGFMKDIDISIGHLLQSEHYLPATELNEIISLKNLKVFEQIRELYHSNNPGYTKEELSKLIDDLAKANKQVNDLCTKFDKQYFTTKQ